MRNPRNPTTQLLMKLGSIVVHTQEMMSPAGHPVDQVAIRTLLDDPEVQQWIEDMGPLLPVKRK